MMTELGVGEMIYSLRKKIQKIQAELDALGEPTKGVPELISSANLLRSNEYLLKSNEKKSELLEAYEQYSGYLENMISDIFEIQNDLKEILKEQSALLSDKTPKRPRPRKTAQKK